MALQNLIFQRHAYTLNETSKKNLARYLQINIKAFQMSSAMHVLKDDDIKLFKMINNEVKVRRSTKLLVLGTAKVMSYKDFKIA